MENSINLSQLRASLSGLFRVQGVAYWTDFLFHLALGYSAFFFAQFQPLDRPITWIAYFVSAFAIYRSVLFIHEIAHFRAQLPRFSVAWNLLCGIPLGMPAFLYYQSHFAHHRAQTYGTVNDGEYTPFARRPRFEIIRYLLLSAVAPALFAVRFLVLVPLSYAIPPLRRWVIAHGSSLVIEGGFVGKAPSAKEAREWFWQEWGTFFFWAGVVLAGVQGWIASSSFVALLVLMSVVHVVNGLRTLAAHRFENEGGPVTMEQQYLDSVNLTGKGWRAVINVLAAPVGLRFHALHHLFPGLPYHALGEAHRRLSTQVPAGSLYHRANEPSVGTALDRLWSEAGHYRLSMKGNPA